MSTMVENRDFPMAGEEVKEGEREREREEVNEEEKSWKIRRFFGLIYMIEPKRNRRTKKERKRKEWK